MSDEEDNEDHASHHHHHHYHPLNEDNVSVESGSVISANIPGGCCRVRVDEESVGSRGRESYEGSAVSFQTNNVPIVEIISDDLAPQEFTDVAINQHPGATFLSAPQHDRMLEFTPHLHQVSEKDSLDSHRNRIAGISPNTRHPKPRLDPCQHSSQASLMSTESCDVIEHRH